MSESVSVGVRPGPIRPFRTPAGPMPYDAPLDGIRAVAVLAVMIYHGFLGWGTGGFLGVDVFFALSGYLITTLLIREHNSTGGIDLRGFWYRRARRLLPALFALMAYVAVYGAFLAGPETLATLRRDGLATLAYAANWNFIASGQSYFDQFQDPSPLRHMWSLAIEEQWYLLWPVIVSIGLRRRSPTWRGWVVALACLAVGSAVLMAVLTPAAGDTSRSYYGTDTRAQTLLVGAALAFLLHRRRGLQDESLSGSTATVLGTAALGVLLGFILAVDDTDRFMYRGGFLLVAGVSSVLVACVTADVAGNAIRGLFGCAPLPAIGRLSYGLYLWHWPVYLTLTPDRVDIGSNRLFVVRFCASFLAAAVSYRLVERPLRGIVVPWRRLGAGAGGVAGALVVALLLATTMPAAGDEQVFTSAAGRSAAGVFVVGDSVYLDLSLSFDVAAHPGVQIRSAAILGCGLLSAGEAPAQTREAGCANQRQEWRAQLAGFRPAAVIAPLSGWDLLDRVIGGRQIRFGSAEFSAFIDEQLDQVVVELGRQGGRLFLLTLPCQAPVETELTIEERVERTAWLNAEVARYAEAHPSELSLVDVSEFACPTGVYQAEVDGVTLHRDGVHYTRDGGRALWNWLLRRLAESVPGLEGGGPDRELTVAVVGDSVAFSLARFAPDGLRAAGIDVRNHATIGCGILRGRYLAEHLEAEAADYNCDERPARWRQMIRAVEPDVTVVLFGAYEVFDWVWEGVRYDFGTPEFASFLAGELSEDAELLARSGGVTVFLSVQCMQPRATGAGPVRGEERGDTGRISWLNRELRSFVSARDDVFLADLAGFTCPSGSYEATRGGVELHRDGLHYTPEGAAKVWQWLVPALRSALDAATREPGEGPAS